MSSMLPIHLAGLFFFGTNAFRLRILEFLFFYLIPETYQKSAHKRSVTKRDTPGGDLQVRRTTEEKSVLLGKYLSNVDGLVHELHTSKPFGDMKHEW